MGAPEILALPLPGTYNLHREKNTKVIKNYQEKSSKQHRRDVIEQYVDMGRDGDLRNRTGLLPMGWG